MISFTQKYLFLYLLRARNRQRLLIFSLLALSLSSFALLVIQSTMGGMQSQVVKRSQNIEGFLELRSINNKQSDFSKIKSILNKQDIPYLLETTKELLLKLNGKIKPVIVHGINKPPFFYKKNISTFEAIVPFHLSFALSIEKNDFITLFSPFIMDNFISDIPRRLTLKVNDFVSTDLPEIDSWHIWINLKKLNGLLGGQNYEKIILYKEPSKKLLSLIKTNAIKNYDIITWKDKHKTLNWALNLENFIMIFLFASMSLLVTLSILSGFLLFWEKIKPDLSLFWVLGVSKKNASKTIFNFLINLNIFSIIIGLLFGSLFLYLFKMFAPNLMPDIFVDRSIPVKFNVIFYMISFLLPLSISFLFSYILTIFFKSDVDFFKSLKKII